MDGQLRHVVAGERGAALEAVGQEPAPWYTGAEPLAPGRWLARLRWATFAVQAGVAILAWSLPDLGLSLRRLLPLIVIAAAANGAMAAWLSRGRPVAAPAAGCALLLDVALLTGLLEITGGPFNPFVVIYAVQVALAAFTIGRAWAWAVGAAAASALAWLVYHHLVPDAGPDHHRLSDLPAHLFTMWVAAAVSAELAGHFAARASAAVARRQRELEEVRARSMRNDRLAALTTLAAGAAHELSTPLATIAVAARELERAATRLDRTGDLAAFLEDARLIRTEVDRCRAILDQMSGRAGGAAADALESVDLARVPAAVGARLTPDRAARLHVRLADGLPPLALPREGLVQVIASLVQNAFDAVGAEQPVRLEISGENGAVRFTVTDEGPGMAPAVLARAGEPFQTTKEPGRGLGLGLFLARVFAERFGGSLTLRTDRGTTAVLELPGGTGAEP